MSTDKETNHFCIRCIKYKTCIKAYKTIADDCKEFNDGKPPYVCPPLIHANQAGWEIRRDNKEIEEKNKIIKKKNNAELILVEWKDPHYEETPISPFEEVNNIIIDKLNCKTFGYLIYQDTDSICISLLKYNDNTYKYTYLIPRLFIQRITYLNKINSISLDQLSKELIHKKVKLTFNDSIFSSYNISIEEIKKLGPITASICGFLIHTSSDAIIVSDKIVDNINYENVHIYQKSIIINLEICDE